MLADDTPAVDAVLKADRVRWSLVQVLFHSHPTWPVRELIEEKFSVLYLFYPCCIIVIIQEEKQLLADLEAGPNEAKDIRLGEVYEELSQIGAASAEAKARRILYGLGFDGEMQVESVLILCFSCFRLDDSKFKMYYRLLDIH